MLAVINNNNQSLHKVDEGMAFLFLIIGPSLLPTTPNLLYKKSSMAG